MQKPSYTADSAVEGSIGMATIYRGLENSVFVPDLNDGLGCPAIAWCARKVKTSSTAGINFSLHDR